MTAHIGSRFGLERLLSQLRREIVRTVRMYHKPPRVGLVSSYDPTKHAVKVQFQPEGTLSGWIPLTAIATGNGFGILSAPNIKDQVEVHFQEGDHMVARVMTRHFSLQVDKPPTVQAGEHHIIHGSGAVMRFLQDGTVFIGGAGTVQTGQIGGGQGGNLSTVSQGQVANPTQQGQQAQPAKPQALQAVTLAPDGSLTINTPQNKITVTAGGTIAISSSGTMTLTAPTIVLNGNIVMGT